MSLQLQASIQISNGQAPEEIQVSGEYEQELYGEQLISKADKQINEYNPGVHQFLQLQANKGETRRVKKLKNRIRKRRDEQRLLQQLRPEMFVQKKERNTPQKLIGQKIDKIIKQTKRALTFNYFREGKRFKMKNQKNFRVAQIDNDVLTEYSSGSDNEDFINKLEDEIDKEQPNKQSKVKKYDVTGRIGDIAERFYSSGMIEEFEGAAFIETDPKVFCSHCKPQNINVTEFTSQLDRYKHYHSQHSIYECIFCQKQFHQRKLEQKHRDTVHSAQIIEAIALDKNKSRKPIITELIKQNIQGQASQVCPIQDCFFQTKDCISYNNHKITQHGDHIHERLTFKIFTNGLILQKRDFKMFDDGKLIGNFRFAEDKLVYLDNSLFNEASKCLMVVYKNRILAYVIYESIESEFDRICIIKELWNSQYYNLELWLLTEKLAELLQNQ